MRDFPQELVDLVIDKLVESIRSGPPHVRISDYSTVSRSWVERTQKHHFDTVFFHRTASLRKWRDIIEPNPSGVSRHVRKIHWAEVDTLKDFYDHIGAFTRVVDMEITNCLFLPDGFQLAFFEPLGQSLERLQVFGGYTMVVPFANFLSTLPHLRRLRTRALAIRSDHHNSMRYLPTIPCFEAANSLDLSLPKYLPGNTGWIPSTTRFCDLRVDVACINGNHCDVNEWIRSSAESLESFTIHEGRLRSTSAPRPIIPSDSDSPPAYPFPELDFSACTSLKYLRFPVLVDQPQFHAASILPSISTSQLFRVILDLQGQEPQRDGSESWKEVDNHLTWLAKRFKDANGGKKMEVFVVMSGEYDRQALRWMKNEWPMPGVKEEATVEIQEWDMPHAMSVSYIERVGPPP